MDKTAEQVVTLNIHEDPIMVQVKLVLNFLGYQ